MAIVESSSRRWNRNLTPPWGLTSGISNVIRQLEIGHTDLLPDLRLGPTLIIASDYGGQHKAATHESFSFLVADLVFCWLWNEERQRVRAAYFSDKRRMSYKALNDRQRRQAMLPFLAAADSIPGVLATVLVDKKFIRSLTMTMEDHLQIPRSLAELPTQINRKITLIAHLGALFIAGLSGQGQNIIWFTDNDDFAANDKRVINLTPLFASIISQYSQCKMGHFRFGTTKCDNGDLFIEDLASIPDLACGALTEIPVCGVLPKSSGIQLPLRGHLPPKAVAILAWLGEQRKALRRLTFVIDEGDNARRIRVRSLELYPD